MPLRPGRQSSVHLYLGFEDELDAFVEGRLQTRHIGSVDEAEGILLRQYVLDKLQCYDHGVVVKRCGVVERGGGGARTHYGIVAGPTTRGILSIKDEIQTAAESIPKSRFAGLIVQSGQKTQRLRGAPFEKIAAFNTVPER